MNKEQFEKIDDRIREASEHVSPPFSEENWEAMNLLLDQEFPEKRRRRFFFMWFLPLLGLSVAGAIAFYTLTDREPALVSKTIASDKAARTQSENIIPRSGNEMANSNHPDAVSADINADTDQASIDLQNNVKKGNFNADRSAANHNFKLNDLQYTNDVNKLRSGNHYGKSFIKSSNKNESGSGSIVAGNDESDHLLTGKDIHFYQDTINDVPSVLEKMIVSLDIIRVSTSIPPTGPSIAMPPFDSVNIVQKAADKKISKLSTLKASGFYLLATGSFVNNSVGKVFGKSSGSYGIGIGYQLNNKLAVQTGFYAGKKKYSADKYDYYFPEGSYYTTVGDVDIDADCNVYDIPVTIRYNVVNSKKYLLYATAGISSYIMKRETYNYSYKKNGMTHSMDKTYTGNSHFLSVAGFSAGYEARLTSSMSILVEPYLKVPLSGVGEGKVKLHSAGLLLGLKYSLPHRK